MRKTDDDKYSCSYLNARTRSWISKLYFLDILVSSPRWIQKPTVDFLNMGVQISLVPPKESKPAREIKLLHNIALLRDMSLGDRVYMFAGYFITKGRSGQQQLTDQEYSGCNGEGPGMYLDSRAKSKCQLYVSQPLTACSFNCITRVETVSLSMTGYLK